MSRPRATEKQLAEIKQIRDKIGQEHLIDALILAGIKTKENFISLNQMKGMSTKQARLVIRSLRKVASGKVKYLLWRGIPGRYPTKLRGNDSGIGKSVVYFISMNDTHVKIGVAKDVDKRLKGLQTGNPHRLKIEAVTPGGVKTEMR